MRDHTPGMPGGIMQAVLLLVVVSAGARVAYELLAPLVPLLLAVAMFCVILTAIFRH